ncbi:unnamed protein product, partial [Meganyctiphanes norvegica]
MVSPSKKKRHIKGRLSGAQQLLKKKGDKNENSNYKPLKGKYFYLDLKGFKGAQTIASDLVNLGGHVEEFLSKEVNYVITNRSFNQAARGGGSPNSDQTASHGVASPSAVALPSPLTPQPLSSLASYSHDSPLNVDSPKEDSKKKAPRTRAEALLERACVRRQGRQGTSDVLENARLWNVPVWPLQKLVKWLTGLKEREKLHTSRTNNNTKLSSSASSGATKVQRMKAPYIKTEAFNRFYKPLYKELSSWPTLHLNCGFGVSPFADPRQVKAKQQAKSSSAHKDDHKEKAGREKKRKEGGYCELCASSYTNLRFHLQSDSHLAFVRDQNNYLDLDELIRGSKEIGETLQSGPLGSLEDLDHVDQSLNCRQVKETSQNKNNNNGGNRDSCTLTLTPSGLTVSTSRPSTPISPAPPSVSETHHTANSVLVVNSESQKDIIKCHTNLVVDKTSEKSPEILEKKLAICDSSTANLGNASESSPLSKLVSSSSTSESTEATSSCLNEVESLKTITSNLASFPEEPVNKLSSSVVLSKSTHNLDEPNTSVSKADTLDSSNVVERVKTSGDKTQPDKAKAVTPKPVSIVRRRSRRLSSLDPQESTTSEGSTSANSVLKPSNKKPKENKKVIFPDSETSQCPPSENKEKEMVRLIQDDDTKIEVFCHKEGSRTSKRLGKTNTDTKTELPAPRETRLTRHRKSSCRSDRSESEISIDSHGVVDDPPSSVDMVDKTAKRGRPRSGQALLDEGPDSLVKCNGGTELLNGAYKLKNRRSSRANSDETDNTTHCRTNGVHHSISEKVVIKDIVSSVNRKKIEYKRSNLRRRTTDQQNISETESVENEKEKIMKNKCKNNIDSRTDGSDVCGESKDTKRRTSLEQGSEKANARRRTGRSFKKKIQIKDDENDDEEEESKPIGRPKGSFKKKIQIKDDENDDAERGRAVGMRNRKTRYDLALLNNEDDDDIFFGFPEEALKFQQSSNRSKSNSTNGSQKCGRPLKEFSSKSKEKDQKKRMSDAERFLRDNKEYYHFEETTDRLRSKSERSPGTKTDEEHEESDQSKSKEELSAKEKSRKSSKRMRIRKDRRGTQSSESSNDDQDNKPTNEDPKSPKAKRRLSHQDSDDSDSYGKIEKLKALKEQRQAEERDRRTKKRLEERKKRLEERGKSEEEPEKNVELKVKESEKVKDTDLEKNSLKDKAKIKTKDESKSNENIIEESSRSKRRVNRESKVIGSSDDEILDKEDKIKEDKKNIFIKNLVKYEEEKNIQFKSRYEECDMFGKEVAELYFSFESVPEQESWYQTYQRFIDGIAENEFVYEDDPLKFVLPYEMPKEYIREQINAIRRSLMSKKKLELAELARKSPRCHASTLAILSDIIPTRKSSRSINSDNHKQRWVFNGISSNGSATVSLEGSTGGMSDLGCDMELLVQHMEQVMQNSIGEIPPASDNSLVQKIAGAGIQLLDDSPDLKKTPPKKRGKKKRILAKRENEYSKLCDSFLASDVDQAFLESLREESKESLQLCPDNILTCDSATVIEEFYKCGCTDRLSCDEFSSADEGTEVSSVASFCDSETIDGSITSETKRVRTSKRRKNLTGWPKVKKKKKSVVASHTDTDDNDSALGCVDDLEPKKKRRIMHNSYNLLEQISSEELASLDADRRASPRKRSSVYYMDSWQFRYRTCK